MGKIKNWTATGAAVSMAVLMAAVAAQAAGGPSLYLPMVAKAPPTPTLTATPVTNTLTATPGATPGATVMPTLTPVGTGTPSASACSLFLTAMKYHVKVSAQYVKPVTSRTEGGSTQEVKVDRNVIMTFDTTSSNVFPTNGSWGANRTSPVAFQTLHVDDYKRYITPPSFDSKTSYTIAPGPQVGTTAAISVDDKCTYAFTVFLWAKHMSDPPADIGNFDSTIATIQSGTAIKIPVGATKLTFSGAVDSYCNGQPPFGPDFVQPTYADLASNSADYGDPTCNNVLYVEGKNGLPNQVLADKTTISWELTPISGP